MRRIVFTVALLLSTAAAGQERQPVGLVAVLRQGAVESLDLSFPANTPMSTIETDLQELGRWTGWRISNEPVRRQGQTLSVHCAVIGAAPERLLDDLVWPVVAALARHERLGILILGAPPAPTAVTFENRFVRLEQSGGQGVLSFQVYIKNADFGSLAELRQADPPQAAPREPWRASWVALAWLLLIAASMAIGMTVYLLMRQRGGHSAQGESLAVGPTRAKGE